MNKLTTVAGLMIVFALGVITAPALAVPELGDLLAPKAFRAAVERVSPALVTVETAGTVGIDRTSKKQRQRIGGLGNPGEGPSTGLIVSSDGIIVTSTFNFIRKPRIITVTLADGRQYIAELLGRDDTRKLCVLKITGETVGDLPTAEFAPVDTLRVGQWAVSVGVGYGGDQRAMSTGIISALGRAGGKAVQTDANISPANYGGPLLDIRGRVIGICVPLNPRQGGRAGSGSEWYDSGIGFAIPMDGLQPLIDRMARGEHLKRGLMGIQPSARVDDAGVKIERVADESPATQAGLQAGDVITHIAGQPVTSLPDIMRALNKHVAGDHVVVRFKRGDEGAVEVRIKLGAGPYKFSAPRAVPANTPDDQGEKDAGADEPEGDADDSGATDESDEPAPEEQAEPAEDESADDDSM